MPITLLKTEGVQGCGGDELPTRGPAFPVPHSLGHWSSVHCDTDESRLKVVASSQSKGNMFILVKERMGGGCGYA